MPTLSRLAWVKEAYTVLEAHYWDGAITDIMVTFAELFESANTYTPLWSKVKMNWVAWEEPLVSTCPRTMNCEKSNPTFVLIKESFWYTG